jgi:hypothetical protein
MLSTKLRDAERQTDLVNHSVRKREQIIFRRAGPDEGLLAVRTSIPCHMLSQK